MLRSFHQAVFGMQNALLLLLAATPAVADVGAISVEVVDAVTRRPVDGVTITAESRDGEVRSATTDKGWALLDMGQGAQNSLPLGMVTNSRCFREGAQNSPH